jgi:hypothetical protein
MPLASKIEVPVDVAKASFGCVSCSAAGLGIAVVATCCSGSSMMLLSATFLLRYS